MSRKGSVYVFLLTVFIMVALIVSYVRFVQFLDQYKHFDVAKDIGSKQGKIIKAIREGERIQLYSQQAAKLAVSHAELSATCGESYLTRFIIGKEGCRLKPDELALTFRQDFNRLLVQYPAGALTDISWQDEVAAKDGYVTTTLQGKKRIPLTEDATQVRAARGASFQGPIAAWPTKDMRVTSEFGNRDIDVTAASKNHPGLDIGAYARTGTPVYAVADGEARFYDKGPNSFVQVVSEKFTIEYVHVKGASGIPASGSVAVKVNDLIGTTLKPAGVPHVHMQIQLPDITRGTVSTLPAWSSHVSDSTVHTPQKSYASFRPGDRAYLDPVCFFDRAYIENILANKADADPANDMEVPAATFETCEAYEQAFRLSERFTAPKQEEAPVSTDARVRATQANIEEHNLMPAISAAAQEEEIPRALILAIITQESQGEPLAISPTGPAGIAQFSADTARGYFSSADRPLINACCTEAEYLACGGASTCVACQDRQQNDCDENADPRFNPQKSVAAQAKFLRNLVDEYSEYEHGVAFAIAAYNGGTCPVNLAISNTGKDRAASWTEVERAIRALPSTITCAGKSTSIRREEIATYGTRVLGYYEEWGGRTVAASQYTSEQIGYYDLSLRINASVSTMFAQAVNTLNNRLLECTDDACVERALAQPLDGVVVQPEPVTGEGCAPVAERVQAHIVSQFQRCIASPQLSCSCALESPVDAKLLVSPHRAVLQRVGETTVVGKAMDGLAYPGEGESEGTDFIQIYTSDGVRNTTDSHTVLTIGPQGAVISSGTPITGTNVKGVYKAEHGLAFAKDDAPACAVAKAPRMYCMRDGKNRMLSFHVDVNPHSTPVVPVNVTKSVAAPGTGTHITFRSAANYPLVHVVVQEPSPMFSEAPSAVHYYWPVYEQSFVVFNRPGGQFVTRSGSEYSFSTPQGSVQFSVFDENMRESALIAVP